MANSHTSVSAPDQRVASLRVLNAPARPAPFKFEAPAATRFSFWGVAGVVFILVAVTAFLILLGSPAGTAMGLSFVSIVLEALPFVVLGSLVSGLVEVFVPREWVVRLVPERKLPGILIAASLGLLIPVCECAV
ncbi:MAG TPA: permease, partial [Tepidisphaeraceae bacterium]|nr:permease [Tepidisphaeraceae bacterium]